MPKIKRAFSMNQFTIDAIDAAGEVWPELAGNRSALLGKIVADWKYNREGDSKRGSLRRIEEQLVNVDGVLAVIDERQSLIVEMMRQLVAGGVQPDALFCAVEDATAPEK